MPSSRRSQKQPEPPPEFFVDRSLGRIQVPNALRDLGLVVHTMWSVYGPSAEQRVDDETWIRESAAKGWVLLTRDARIRYVRSEREAIQRAQAKVFRVARGALTAQQQIAWLTNNLNRILQRARKPGPSIYVVYEHGVVRQWPV